MTGSGRDNWNKRRLSIITGLWNLSGLAGCLVFQMLRTDAERISMATGKNLCSQ